MASSNTEVANLAISHLGIGKEIANLETENSEEANACRRFYDQARDQTLRDFPWPFARKYVDPGLVTEDPTTEWQYAYRYPSDCVAVRRILGASRNPGVSDKEPYWVARDADGLLIYTDLSGPTLEYTYRHDEEVRWPSDFVMAMSFRLAYYVAPRITAGDPFQLQQRMAQNYLFEISRAQAASMNEQRRDVKPESVFITSRD